MTLPASGTAISLDLALATYVPVVACAWLESGTEWDADECVRRVYQNLAEVYGAVDPVILDRALTVCVGREHWSKRFHCWLSEQEKPQ